MKGDKWVLILLDTHNDVVEQSPFIYQEDKEVTQEDLIEQYDEIFERRMEEGNNEDDEPDLDDELL
jgi:hypothetical protein